MTSNDWIASMASRLAHLHAADEAIVWEAIPPLFPEVYGAPCDRMNPYHIALASAVVRAVKAPTEVPAGWVRGSFWRAPRLF